MSVEVWIGLAAGAAVLVTAIVVAVVVVAVRRRRALPGVEPDRGEAREAPARDTVMARLRVGLSRTKGQLVRRIDELFASGRIDDSLLSQLEEVLIAADVGVRTTARMLDELRASLKGEETTEPTYVRTWLRERMARIVAGREAPLACQPEVGPLVILVVGVNGSGKTTTIGKLASRYTRAGDQVMLAAADTFRAAAIEQLEIWGERAGAEVIRREEGADPASVAHDAMAAALAREADVLICDTAGRLHTKVPLMDELKKVKRVIGKQMPTAPHEVLLVIDANTGQNAIAQARSFSEVVDITGIVLTKLDGTAKGGVIVGICDELGIPVKLIGIGEQVDDLRDFVAEDFIEALFEPSDDLDSPPAPQ
jgi:fused signal recognition particle receptor